MIFDPNEYAGGYDGIQQCTARDEVLSVGSTCERRVRNYVGNLSGRRMALAMLGSGLLARKWNHVRISSIPDVSIRLDMATAQPTGVGIGQHQSAPPNSTCGVCVPEFLQPNQRSVIHGIRDRGVTLHEWGARDTALHLLGSLGYFILKHPRSNTFRSRRVPRLCFFI